MAITPWRCPKCREPIGVILLGNLLIVSGGAKSVQQTSKDGSWVVTCGRCGKDKVFVGMHVLFAKRQESMRL